MLMSLTEYENEEMSVRVGDVIQTQALLESQRDMAVRFSKHAIKSQNYGLYLQLREDFELARDLLSLSMFGDHEDIEFPEYEEDRPFFDDATLDWLYSDGSRIEDTADVPF